MDTFERFEQVLHTVNERSFDEIALQLFHFQAKHNPVYSEYIRHLRVDPARVQHVSRIPYLPVSFFKTHEVKTGSWPTEVTFTSSGTTGSHPARHSVHRLDFYLDHASRCFRHFYGDPSQYEILALLPSYMERQGSSLVAMIDDFIQRGGGGFYHGRTDALVEAARSSHRKVLVWGVTYALLDLSETGASLTGSIVMETGGMKGRRKEITREELHKTLQSRLAVPSIHSEYGMTELMSQAYAQQGGFYRCPPWMRVFLRDLEDPFDLSEARPSGGVNIIDLANVRTCAFIETQDLGRRAENQAFEIVGRVDNSDVRGCNLMVE